MAEITLLSQLQQSTASRAGAPDGNIYFNPDGTLELITVEELATVDFGGGPVANPLTNADGISMNMLYRFERQERRVDENLRELDPFIEGSFKLAGAYNFIFGRKLSEVAVGGGLASDRQKIRSSGFIEYAQGGGGNTLVDRIYIGNLGLGTILAASQIYGQTALNGVTFDLAFTGNANEVVQVFGDTANGDAGAGDFDATAFEALTVRTFGQTHDRKFASDAGNTELSGYRAGFALGEAPNPYHVTAGNPTIGNVFPSGGAVAPYDTMAFETLAAPENLTGLINTGTSNPESGQFSGVIRNPNMGSLAQMVAYMDALVIQDADIDTGVGARNGKQNPTLYTLDAQGNVVLEPGIYLENVPVADRASVRYTDDDADALVYETVAGGTIEVGANAAADPNAWYHMFILDDVAAANDFNTLNAITVQDSSGADIKGNVGGLTSIPWDFAYSTNTQGGKAAGTDLIVVVEVEGDGGATFQKTVYNITSSASQTINCQPGAENNI